ncbi:MAG: gamma-glutamyltransferase, partial [Thermomicrobiales bacterium]
RLPALARSLRLIADEGRDAFYAGRIAGQIAATAARLGGRLSMLDLAGHRGEWVAPVSTRYRDATVATMPPNSQGITTLMALNMLAGVDPGAVWGAVDHLHPLIEASRLAHGIRDRTVTDPRFSDADTAALLSPGAASEAWSRYDPAAALPGTVARAGDTVAICVVDRDGDAVSMIQSIYQGFGSGVVAGDTGIVLQNRGASFSLDPDHPNVIAPEKRPFHTLMPSMLFRDGALLGPLATQGGDAQAQIQLQIITNLLDFDMLATPTAAIDAPRWVATAGGEDRRSLVLLEGRFPRETMRALADRGHRTEAIPAWSPDAGHAQLILRHPSGTMLGAADARADGVALGY